ncbi:MAG: hypothetical protein JWP59_1849 [Massilia sp.]|nr:hypothetical protein [Massilia sp.]
MPAAAGIALVAVLAGIAWLIGAERADSQAAIVVASAAAPAPALSGAGAAPPGVVISAISPAERRRQLLENVQLTEHTYCNYRDSSKYPHTSRPIAEQPDQVYPNAPVSEANAMRKDGGGADPNVLIQTSQTRVYLAAGESVSFSLRAVDKDGAVLPLVVTGATAQGMNFGKQRPLSPLSLPFVDDGSGADPVPGDSAFAATLTPSQSSLANFNGTIRTRVAYSVGGQNGSVAFDVINSAELPAVWMGAARETVENGSLSYVLKADIRSPGRYVVSGRVDDAKGKPFALVNFNEMLQSGPNEIKLTVFGKLLRDQEAALPLTLRDVDAYLLKENTDPDRALMPRLEGKVLTGKSYPLKSFDDGEWRSEERERHLAEFGKDMKAARAAFAVVDAAHLPAPACPLP